MPAYQLFLNLGGIANLSYLRRTPASQPGPQHAHTWQPGQRTHQAWDACGCNQLLNRLAQQHNPHWAYDAKGELARQGQLLPPLLQALQNLPYHGLPAPKSLSNQNVLETEWQLVQAAEGTVPDKLHTVVEYIALCLADSLRLLQLPPQGPNTLLCTGGGAHNQYLLQRLGHHLQPLGIQPLVPTEPGWTDFKEAILFAFLGLMRLQNQPNTLPQATGASRAASAGTVSLLALP
jgi:anhydro-N-acetylmuramic acid kinase